MSENSTKPPQEAQPCPTADAEKQQPTITQSTAMTIEKVEIIPIKKTG